MVRDARSAVVKNELLDIASMFPHKFDDNGRCEMLMEDNSCMVYEDRPLICNVKKVHERFFSEVKQEDFFKANEDVCKKLQEENNFTV